MYAISIMYIYYVCMGIFDSSHETSITPLSLRCSSVLLKFKDKNLGIREIWTLIGQVKVVYSAGRLQHLSPLTLSGFFSRYSGGLCFGNTLEIASQFSWFVVICHLWVYFNI